MNKLYYIILSLCITLITSYCVISNNIYYKNIQKRDVEIRELNKNYQFLEKENKMFQEEIKETQENNNNIIKENEKLKESNSALNKEIASLKKKVSSCSNIATSAPTYNTQSKTYRLTSFWNGDGYGTNSCTGSGKCERDFQINSNGWYTYQGKLVVATATPYLLNHGWSKVNGIEYHKYYDTMTININGTDYQAIVLDSCGACMKKNIIDLFVSGKRSSITTMVTVR